MNLLNKFKLHLRRKKKIESRPDIEIIREIEYPSMKEKKNDNTSEPNKSNKNSSYKPSKPLNPMELIDELQSIEDFLRESANYMKNH